MAYLHYGDIDQEILIKIICSKGVFLLTSARLSIFSHYHGLPTSIFKIFIPYNTFEYYQVR